MSRVARSWAPLALLLALLSGCQSVLWDGQSPDHTRAARVIERRGLQRLEVGSVSHPSFRAVAPESVAFSRDGGVAYAARIAGGWTVVVDGIAILPPADGVADVSWSAAAGTLIAVVSDARGERVVVVRDARSRRPRIEHGASFDAIAARSLATTAAGHVAYVGMRRAGAQVVVDRLVGPTFDGVAQLHLAPDGAPSYLARRGEETWVVRRGVRDGPHQDVAQIVVGADGERTVAVVRGADGWHVDDVASRSAAYDRIGDLTVVGKHAAFRGRRDGAEWIVVDGVETGPFLRVRPGSLRLLGPGGERVVFAAADVTGERVHGGGAATSAWSAIEEVVASDDGRVGFVARDGAAFAVVVEGRLQGTFVWAGDLRIGRDGAVFAAREHDRDVVIEGGRRHDVQGLVRGSLRLAADGRTWGALVHRASGLGLESAHGRVELDVADLTGEMLRRRDGGASTAVLADWMAAELERVAAAP